jgi:HSP20 family molecular chaperone IbpA
MAERTVPARQPEQKVSDRETTRSVQGHIPPPVDIYELDDGLTVVADLPGVAKEGLDVRVENNVLTIRGKATHGDSGEPLYREYQLVDFFRQFELGDKVDQSKISAELKQGVLTLRLPRVEEAKPRKIEVAVN